MSEAKPKKYRKRKKKGDVFQRGEHWNYDFQIRGRRYRGAIPEALNQAQAARAVTQLKNRIYEGTFGDGVKMLFADFVKEVYEPAAKLKRCYETYEKFHIKTLLEYFKGYTLGEISVFAVEKFKREYLNKKAKGDKPRQPSSVNRALAVLSGILTMARKQKLIRENPCSEVKRLREDNARTRYLTGEEEHQLITAINKRYERMRPMIILALNCGMRLGEIVNLKWQQVEWERNRISVINTKNAVDRSVPMNATVKELLLQLWRQSDKNDSRVFPEQISSAISLSFRFLVRRSKLPDLHFHDLRHTFATRLAEAGVDAFTIAALLGHKTLSQTARYTHPSDGHKRKAVEALGNFAQDCQKNVTIEFPGRTKQGVSS